MKWVFVYSSGEILCCNTTSGHWVTIWLIHLFETYSSSGSFLGVTGVSSSYMNSFLFQSF